MFYMRMQGLGEQITPLVSSSLEMVGKIIIAFTLVPLLGYTGVISSRAACMVYHGDTAFGEDTQCRCLGSRGMGFEKRVKQALIQHQKKSHLEPFVSGYAVQSVYQNGNFRLLSVQSLPS